MALSATMYLLKKQHQLLKFGTAGIMNTAVDWLLFFLISDILRQSDLVAKAGGAVGGVTSAFLLSILWVFRNNFVAQLELEAGLAARIKFILSKYLQTIAVYAAGMLLNVGVFFLCKRLGAPDLLSLTAATCCSFLVNFLLSSKLVFRSKQVSA